MSKRSLKAAIEAGEFVIAPGLHDMIAAVICNKVGFDFVYASGYWTTASAYGLPDAGIATYSQMLDRVATLVRTVNAGVIADADTGYGGLLNVHHTVRGYEEVGVSRMVRRATCFITAWLGVRVLPAPPRTLVLTEISRNLAISPELAELPSVILSLHRRR